MSSQTTQIGNTGANRNALDCDRVHGITRQAADIFLNSLHGYFSPISNRMGEIGKKRTSRPEVRGLWETSGSDPFDRSPMRFC